MPHAHSTEHKTNLRYNKTTLPTEITKLTWTCHCAELSGSPVSEGIAARPAQLARGRLLQEELV